MFLCVCVCCSFSLLFFIGLFGKRPGKAVLTLCEVYRTYTLYRQEVTQKSVFHMKAQIHQTPPGYDPSDVPHDLYNESVPVQWMCAVMSRPCSFAERFSGGGWG